MLRAIGTPPDLAAEDAPEHGAFQVEVGRLALVRHPHKDAPGHPAIAGPTGNSGGVGRAIANRDQPALATVDGAPHRDPLHVATG